MSRDILTNHGSLEKNSLIKLIDRNDDPRDESSAPLIKKSEYYSCDGFLKSLEKFQSGFSCFCINIQGIKEKMHELEVISGKVSESNLNLSCIMVQETHLDKDVCSSMYLEGYNTICQSPIVSKYGGLAIFLKKNILFEEVFFQSDSKLWEGQFLELKFDGRSDKIMVANLYKKCNNYNVGELTTFINEIDSVLRSFGEKIF